MRFVILEHDHPELHWDFMIQRGDVLRTWRLARPPESGGDPIAATALFDHRLMYLDYEGAVSGGRGSVKRWDAGQYREEPEDCPTVERIRLRMEGKRLRGLVTLEREQEDRWVFRLIPGA